MGDLIRLTVPSERQYAHVVALVLGGLGARLRFPWDRVDELQLAVTSALAAGSPADELTIDADVDDAGVTVRVGPLATDGAGDADLLRVLERLVDRASIEDGPAGTFVQLRVVEPGR